MNVDQSAVGLATLYCDLGRELTRPDSRTDALLAVIRVALARVPGTEWVSITEGRNKRFATAVTTDEAAREVDEIQYALGSGPCVDAVLNDATFRTGDLPNDGRWPEFGRRAFEAHQVTSMLSFRLYLEDDDRIAALNLYSTNTDAFDDTAQVIGTLIATHGALAVAAAAAREQATQLRRALVTNREIGTAMGVLMATNKLTRGQAFDLLRIASQNSNRKLVDVAAEVADTGVLDLPGALRPRGD
jgi:transcriptional regulator with GAF, ATPase, and Fis domain